ncbi:MAG: cupin domain-containing protein [Paracoccaceae bacterium]
MTTDSPPAHPILGERIRGLRKRRGLTLADLAARTRLSPGYISQIERNLAQPSIPALVSLAASLDVTVQWFFSGPGEAPVEERGYVVRARNRLRIDYDTGIMDELLTPKLSAQVEMILCRLPPGSGAKEAYSHKGDEVGLVMEGELELWVGERHFHLHAGDSCSFTSTEPHRYRNPGSVEAVVLWAISPPAF